MENIFTINLFVKIVLIKTDDNIIILLYSEVVKIIRIITNSSIIKNSVKYNN